MPDICFCDSGMKCLGEVFHYLAAFLCRETAWKLACTDEYAALRLRTGTVERDGLPAVFLRIRLEHVSEMDCFRALINWVKWRNRRLDGPSFRFLMHESAGVFQKGLELHERSPRPYRPRRHTYVRASCEPESSRISYKVSPLLQYVELTWHPSYRNVGILMVTRRQYKKRCRGKWREVDRYRPESFLPESQIHHLPMCEMCESAFDVYNRYGST